MQQPQAKKFLSAVRDNWQIITALVVMLITVGQAMAVFSEHSRRIESLEREVSETARALNEMKLSVVRVEVGVMHLRGDVSTLLERTKRGANE